MNRSLHYTAFIAGLAAIAWVVAGYLPGHPLAVALVLPIVVAYLAGATELHRYRQATAGLRDVLSTTTEPPASLGAWIDRLPASLQSSVRQRVAGDRVPLPAPTLAPYLAGLAVLLGMLGTFLGMVVTLQGTGLALENATDVDAIRASLAAPVKGLGLAFGTSVAGVAASAMLGLMSTLARRDRQRTAQQLDARIATELHGHTRAHRDDARRDESMQLWRTQAEGLPAVVLHLKTLIDQIERQGQAQHDRLLASQTHFQDEARRAYAGLADSVDRTLRASLAESARLAGAAIAPAVQTTMAGIAHETATLRDALAAAAHRQLDGVTARLDATTTQLTDRWAASCADMLAGQRQGHEALMRQTHETATATLAGIERHTAGLLHDITDAQAARDAAAGLHDRERMSAFHDGIATLTATLERQGAQQVEALADRQQQICRTLEDTATTLATQADTQARATLAEIARLVQAAAEAPRAAAEVIGELRRSLSDSLVRDNAALDERNHLVATLGRLLDAVDHASTGQRDAVDAMVRATTDMLDRVGTRFAETVDAGSHSLQAVAAQVTGSAAEVASLGEGFGVAVQLFGRASEQLTLQLERIESALGQTLSRSDEQLAYYVAQAREIVDLTLASQKQIVDDLQQLARAPAKADAA